MSNLLFLKLCWTVQSPNLGPMFCKCTHGTVHVSDSPCALCYPSVLLEPMYHISDSLYTRMKPWRTTATNRRQIKVTWKSVFLSFGVVTNKSDAFLSREVSGWVAELQGVKWSPYGIFWHTHLPTEKLVLLELEPKHLPALSHLL